MKVFRTEHGELGHPPLVSIHQPSMERTLVAALEQRGVVDLRWGTRVETLDRAAGHVTAWLRPAGGERAEPLRARYLVGCDGGRSAVRDQLGDPLRRIDVRAALARRRHARRPPASRRCRTPTSSATCAGPIVTLPMSPGRHRWEWMLHPGEDEAPFLDPARIARAAGAVAVDGERVEVERAVVYTFHARTRAALAGRSRAAGRRRRARDAAVRRPGLLLRRPRRGQPGMEARRGDRRARPSALLDTYEAERHPHVRSMQNLAVRWGGVVQTTEPGGRPAARREHRAARPQRRPALDRRPRQAASALPPRGLRARRRQALPPARRPRREAGPRLGRRRQLSRRRRRLARRRAARGRAPARARLDPAAPRPLRLRRQRHARGAERAASDARRLTDTKGTYDHGHSNGPHRAARPRPRRGRRLPARRRRHGGDRAQPRRRRVPDLQRAPSRARPDPGSRPARL